nr:hypothetical protein [Stenotrophomonas maltophilia]
MFYHFYSKQDLIDATFASWLPGFNLDVERRMRTNGLLVRSLYRCLR